MLEVEDVPEVGAAPLVDRLVRVADDAEVAMMLGEPLDQQVLRPVGVLVFVHHHVPELSRVARRGPTRTSRTARRVLSSRSSKSSALALGQRLPVELVDLPDLLVARIPCPRRSVSGPSMRFFAWLMRESATRGCTSESSMFSSFSACLTTDS